MRTIKISDFKQHCLSLLKRLEPEGLIITKHGKPLARVVPFDRDSASLIGALKGKGSVKGDILRTGAKWKGQPDTLKVNPWKRF
jgi:prevent-host-death family protein